MKKIILIVFGLQAFLSVLGQSLTFDQGDVNKTAAISSAKTFAYILINAGLLIGAAPTGARLFRGEHSARKEVVNWLIAALICNILIEAIPAIFIK